MLAFSCGDAAKYLHNSAALNVLRAPMSFFDTTPLGRILNRFSRDQDTIDNQLYETLRITITLFVTGIFTFAVIAVVNYYFIIPFIPIIYLYYLIQAYYRSTSRELKRLDAISRSPIYAHFAESLAGLASIRAYNDQKRFISLNQKYLDSNNQVYYLQNQAQRWVAMRIELQGACMTFSAAIVCFFFSF